MMIISFTLLFLCIISLSRFLEFGNSLTLEVWIFHIGVRTKYLVRNQPTCIYITASDTEGLWWKGRSGNGNFLPKSDLRADLIHIKVRISGKLRIAAQRNTSPISHSLIISFPGLQKGRKPFLHTKLWKWAALWKLPAVLCRWREQFENVSCT